MMKRSSLFFLFSFFSFFLTYAEEGRYTIRLRGRGWFLWLNEEVNWVNDHLYLPHKITDLSLLPINHHIDGWLVLNKHFLFAGLSENDALIWSYQVVVKNGNERFDYRIQGEKFVVDSYSNTTFELSIALGIIPCGKGEIIFSSLNIADQLNNLFGSVEVAGKILCNYIKYSLNNQLL